MDTVSQIKQKLDIVDVIAGYISVKKAGKNYKAICPFHSEDTPSFMVSPEIQRYKCFGCFPPGSLIQTPSSLIPIEQLKVGDAVLSGSGKTRRTLHTFRRSYAGNLITLKVRMLNNPVTLTQDHNVFTIGQGYTLTYKNLSRRLKKYASYNKDEQLKRLHKYFPIKKTRADNLKPGQSVLYPISDYFEDMDYINLEDYYSEKTLKSGKLPKSINLNIPVAKDFLTIVGWYLAEGSSHRAYIRFSLGNEELHVAAQLLEAFRRLFDLEGGIHIRSGSKSGIEVSICHSMLANIFVNMFGRGASNKRLPQELVNLPANKLKTLLEAYALGDGKKSRYSGNVTTISQILAQQLINILLKLGYFPNCGIGKSYVSDEGVDHRRSYTIGWSDLQKGHLFNKVYVDQLGNRYWILPIVSVESSQFYGDVYNLNVDVDHSYLTQSFSVANCGESGDIFNFVQKMEGVEFPDALERLAEKAGVKIEKKEYDPSTKKKSVIYKINQLTASFYHHILTKHKVGKSALDYIKKQRKLTPKSIESFKLGYAPDKWDLLLSFLSKRGFSLGEMLSAGVITKKRDAEGYIDKFRGRVMFPLIDTSNKVVGFTGRDVVGRDPKYLNTEETLVFHKSSYLYGLDKAKVAIKKTRALFVEGQIDVLTSYQNGVENVIASSGTSLTQAQLKIISRYTKDLTFCFDTDSAGISATLRAVALAENSDFNINVVPIPDKYADLDDFMKSSKKEALALLKNPVPVYDYFLAAALKLYDKKTAYGKKEIVNYLAPILSKVKNQVTLDHYVKRISDETDISEDAIRSTVKSGAFDRGDSKRLHGTVELAKVPSLRNSIEHYLLSLLIKGNVDTIRPLLYKLGTKDFTFPETKKLFNALKKYVESKPNKFDIQYFVENYSGDIRELVLEMYLWDLGGIESDQKAFASDLEAAFSRIKNNTVKRELKDITEQIKLAELEKNTQVVKDLSKKFKDLSKKLI